MLLTASLLGAKQNRDSVENNPASLLVVSLSKTLNGMPPSLCGGQVAGGKQSTRRGGPVLLKTCKRSLSANAMWPIYTSSNIKLTTNSSNDEEEEAAYDTVRHRGLTCKLLRLLPDKHMVPMIMKLVRNRSFTLTIGDSKQTRLRRLRNGLPQGSVLAPSFLTSTHTICLP